MTRRLVNVADDEYAGHGVNSSIVTESEASHPNVPPASNSAVVKTTAEPPESLQYHRESPAPVGAPSTAYAAPPVDGVTIILILAVAGHPPGSEAENVRLFVLTRDPLSKAR